jgi:hypothetical protein
MSTNLEEHSKRSAKVRMFFSTVLGLGFVVVISAAIYIHNYQRATSTGIYRTKYEGKIIEKSLTVGESELGSYPVRKLHIRGKNGQEFQVIVNDNLYGRAQQGMWIKSSKTGAELTREEP